MLNKEKYIENYDEIYFRTEKALHLLGFWFEKYARPMQPDIDLVEKWMRGGHHDAADEKELQLMQHSAQWIIEYQDIIEFIDIAKDYVTQVHSLIEECSDK